MSHSSPGARRRTPDPRLPVRAGRLLRVRTIWVATLVVGSLVVAAMSALYIASATDPLAHLSGLPVAVVDQDRGAAAGTQQLQIGQQIEAGLLAAPAVTDRLHLEAMTLPQAEQAMDRDGLYATLVIPPGFTANLLTATGLAPRARASPPPPRRWRSSSISGRARSGPRWQPGSCSPRWRWRPVRSAGTWPPLFRPARRRPPPGCCWPTRSR